MTISNILPFLGAAVVILAIFFAITRRTGQSVKTISQSSLPVVPAVRCFKCGKQMEEGFVLIGGISWRSVDSSPRKFTGSGEKLKNISPDQSFLLFRQGIPENRAFRCTDCLVVTIDHSQLYMFVKK